MPRKKTIIEQPINLSDDVRVTVSWPKGEKPVIDWNGDTISVRLAGAPVVKNVSARERILGPEETNGPTEDTPEIAAMKANLPNPFGGSQPLPFGAKTSDLFGGEDVTGESLEMLAQSLGGGI